MPITRCSGARPSDARSRRIGRPGREALEIDRAERPQHGPAAPQPLVARRRARRHAEQAIRSPAEQPSIPRQPRDRVGAAVRPDQTGRAAAPVLGGRAHGDHVVARVPGVDDVEAALAQQPREPARIPGIAPPDRTARAGELEQGLDARRPRLLRQRVGPPVRILGAHQLRGAATRALRQQELQHGRRGPRPLPVAGDVKDPQSRPRESRRATRSISHSFAYLRSTWKAVTAAIRKPGIPSRNPALSR